MKYIQKQSYFYYALLVLYSVIGPQLIPVDNNYQGDSLSIHPVFAIVLFYFGAIIETLVFSTLVFNLLERIRFFKEKPLFIIVIGSILFGLAHYSSIEFVIVTFFSGLVLNINYWQYLKKNDHLVASIATFILHFCVNLTLYIIYVFFIK